MSTKHWWSLSILRVHVLWDTLCSLFYRLQIYLYGHLIARRYLDQLLDRNGILQKIGFIGRYRPLEIDMISSEWYRKRLMCGFKFSCMSERFFKNMYRYQKKFSFMKLIKRFIIKFSISLHDFFCMEETWEHVSLQWQHGNHQLWVICFMCLNWFRSRASESQGISAICY